ncbi:hypothetical protein SAMN05421636_105340 [Pricia antarctica]|uniref:Uncharacterized protein n=1 Tax=Pricia antarctica TaxID=641691 RepID=A0A1G7DI92_9FLAO|nr:hypothetical protein SAMN05421636_105340 [Pricia antarctica]
MILLPNGCNCSKPTLKPTNWKTSKASTKKPWYVQYYFRDPLFKDRYPNGKYMVVKGMNRIKDLEERRKPVQSIIDVNCKCCAWKDTNLLRENTIRRPRQ